MAQYHRGRDFEHAVRRELVADGYDVIRSAGSKTKIDLVAFKARQILLIQCKLDANASPAERADLLRVTALLPNYAVPLIAWKRPRVSQIHYSRLTGTQHNQREPWTPDAVAAVAS
ncbi:restriction endonuclease [Kribbella sp. NPDC059898]|uniref:restriction endonuclease n=1 Tax=Kribbella sp. NPDC059898 TaxID=3346995 RepID=UPI003648E51C